MNVAEKSTIIFKKPVGVKSWASVVGKKESQGPLKSYFDITITDTHFNKKTWEQAESTMQKMAVEKALEKGELTPNDIGCIFAGDLTNQCIASTFGLMDFNRSFLSLYGACSTMAQSLLISSVFINSGAFNRCVAVTSSHFCSSERQYRFPLEYASIRTPTSQWTVTGSGAVVLTNEECKIKIKSVCVGKVQDLGIKDQNNMGAAMAPAAANTIKEFFKDTATTADDYDAIFTGDLGAVGSELMYRLLEKDKINVRHLHKDCGNLIFNPKTQSNINSGGSGCGCSASVLCSYILGGMQTGKLKDVLFVATGAMLSPTSVMQGQNVPSIAHLVYLSAQ